MNVINLHGYIQMYCTVLIRLYYYNYMQWYQNNCRMIECTSIRLKLDSPPIYCTYR